MAEAPGRALLPGICALILFLGGGSRSAWAQPTPAPPGAQQQLFEAAVSGDTNAVTALLDSGIDVSCRDHKMATPLVHVLRTAKAPLSEPQRRCLTLLLDKGADPNAADEDKRTALIYAAQLGDLATVRLLVEREAFAKSRDKFQRTALLYAVQGGHRPVVEYLANNGELQSLAPADRRRLAAGKQPQNK